MLCLDVRWDFRGSTALFQWIVLDRFQWKLLGDVKRSERARLATCELYPRTWLHKILHVLVWTQENILPCIRIIDISANQVCSARRNRVEPPSVQARYHSSQCSVCSDVSREMVDRGFTKYIQTFTTSPAVTVCVLDHENNRLPEETGPPRVLILCTFNSRRHPRHLVWRRQFAFAQHCRVRFVCVCVCVVFFSSFHTHTVHLSVYTVTDCAQVRRFVKRWYSLSCLCPSTF